MDDAIRRIADLEAQLAQLQTDVSRLVGPYKRVFPVLRDDADDNPNQWQEQTVVDSTVEEFTDGRASTAADNFNVIDDYDTEVLMEFHSAGETRYLSLLRAGTEIIVDVLTDGGDGDATPFTYTVTSKGGTQLMTLAAPEWVYEPNVKVTAATHGTAYRKDDGTWALYQVDEVPDDTECP